MKVSFCMNEVRALYSEGEEREHECMTYQTELVHHDTGDVDDDVAGLEPREVGEGVSHGEDVATDSWEGVRGRERCG